MYLVDFIFDGIKLSDFGCMVGSAVTGNNDAINMGSVINLETVINHGSYISEIVNADYPEVYTVTFDIVKKPCGGYEDHFTDREATFFMRWLNRKEYCKFIPIYDDNHSFHRTFLMGTFTTCQAINMSGKILGFALTFTSNSPFSYTDIFPRKFVMNSINNYSFTIYDESDELGAVYPSKFIITIGSSAGDLWLWNDQDTNNKNGRHTEVLNVVPGEVLTFDCIHKVITSSEPHTTLYNDFNYIFPRLSNTLISNANNFKSENQIECNVEIEYNPIRKAGVIA